MSRDERRDHASKGSRVEGEYCPVSALLQSPTGRPRRLPGPPFGSSTV